MEKKLKVYGGAACINGSSKQHRVIVAAYSKKEAIKLLNATCRGRFTYAHFADYWCETGNVKELATATTRGVWYYTDLGSRILLVCLTTKQDPT